MARTHVSIPIYNHRITVLRFFFSVTCGRDESVRPLRLPRPRANARIGKLCQRRHSDFSLDGWIGVQKLLRWMNLGKTASMISIKNAAAKLCIIVDRPRFRFVAARSLKELRIS